MKTISNTWVTVDQRLVSANEFIASVFGSLAPLSNDLFFCISKSSGESSLFDNFGFHVLWGTKEALSECVKSR